MILFLSSVAAAYAGVILLLVWKQDALVFPGAGRGDRGHGGHPRVQPHTVERTMNPWSSGPKPFEPIHEEIP